MASVAAPAFAASALVAALLVVGCGDLFHATNWSSCEGEQCPSSSSAGGAGVGGASSGGSGGGPAGPGTGGSGGGPTPEAMACATFGERICARLAECIPVAVDLAFTDAADCAARQALACEAIAFGPGIGYAAAELETCYEALYDPAQSCGYFLRELYGQVGNPACALEGGTLATGEPCAVGGQCQEGRCDVPPGDVCGVCASYVPVGGDCATAPCTPASACVGGKCVALGDEDAGCSTHAECFADLACLGSLFEGQRCTPQLALGDPCDSSQGGCPLYTVCGSSKACEPLGTATLGESCGSLPAGPTYCLSPSACEVTDTFTNQGTCVPVVELGGDCTFEGPFQSACRHPGRCVEGTCVQVSTEACAR